ncbi:MAG: ATP synthase F1 subunit delta [Candidatus Magasanikbacteria bacterium CG10_big_fil_rev_8_21_14_0_10_36_16]|uniref:ATP synthase subunit delta n=1 Tax=Candidatus Magasanikbacteria bacterium CG10_big_fil_rev_8_21_14_0_10_36_16 TaxID=1974645 RepID=A0A2H0TYH3_9BACT|nr:MAG: ATP synthase F1 subunit delta [Candidatus Magasanikbacteria bacterium CG10_big_fil_rev_8_21_14_0_10_36_16]
MKKISNKQFAEALYELTADLNVSDLDVVLKNFVNLLAKKHKIKQTKNIIAEFEIILKKKQGIVELEITSARELDKGVVEKIKQAFAKEVELIEKVDKSLIGGIRVKIADKILDASVKTQLSNLKKSLTV